jgi:hypothetical protein
MKITKRIYYWYNKQTGETTYNSVKITWIRNKAQIKGGSGVGKHAFEKKGSVGCEPSQQPSLCKRCFSEA